jgi:formamidopyrimidine-DNA glycosylase
MPELPEVEAARIRITEWTCERELVAVRWVDDGVVRSHLSSRPRDAIATGRAWLESALGARGGPVERHGKRLRWRIGPILASAHLGMSGKWVRRAPTEATPLHARLGLQFDDAVAWLVDPRRFGCLAPAGPGDWRAGLGPDAWLEPLRGPELAARMVGVRALHPGLLEQARLAGLGNIHAAEALWRARLHPGRSAASLSPAAWDALALAIRAQLAHALDQFAASEEVTYLSEGGDADGFAVYGRAGGGCSRCGSSVERAPWGGRSVFFCLMCQPRDGAAETGY